jgi:hypothetical protein
MSNRKPRELDRDYTSEVDTVDDQAWSRILREFDDANIYQTWAYGAVTSGRRSMGHLILRKQGEIVAAAQARIVELPFINIGIAYVRWGPLWRRPLAQENVETFRQAVRALRNEFACRRGLVLRLYPVVPEDDPARLPAIMAEEGFSPSGDGMRGRTIVMDLGPSLEDLREGMRPHWKRELKLAGRKQLEVVEGTGDELFEAVIRIHDEMVSRKRFVGGNDINQFRLIQAGLPENLKMKIMLARSSAGVCAGLVYSTLGKTAIYLFGATSNIGMKSNGSYLLHWKVIQRLKEAGVAVYDLNGINPVKNPGTYKFKHDLAGMHGRDVCFAGRFDSCASPLSRWVVECADALRTMSARSAMSTALRRLATRTKTGSFRLPASPRRSESI